MNVQLSLVSDSYKRMEGEPFPQSGTLRLVSGRRDAVALQLAATADQPFALNVGKGEWCSEKGTPLKLRVEIAAPFSSKMQIEGMIRDDDERMKADLLLEQDVLEYGAGEVGMVWIETVVPETAAAGEYSCEAAVYASTGLEDEKLLRRLPFTLSVKDYIMPLPRDYRFYLDLWQHSSNIARKHDVLLWSDEHFRVLENYAASLAELGQKAVTVVATEIPWCGQSCFMATRNPSNLFEYAMIRTVREADGSFQYDYTPMERYIELCFQKGIDREIEVFGLVNVWAKEGTPYETLCPDYPDNLRIRYLDRADGCYKYMREAGQIEDFIRSLERYFIHKGLMEKVRVVADEPGDMVKYRRSLEKIREIAPAFQFKTAINHAEFIGEFGQEISDFVPFLQCMCSEWDRLKEYREKLTGKRFLYYLCCSPFHFNNFIHSPLLESRFIPIFAAYTGFDGFLRWNYTVWPEEPRREIRYGDFSAGDLNHVYPGRNGAPLLTLRYKLLKRGIEDFELIVRLKEKGKADLVERIFQLLIRERDIRRYFEADCHSLLPTEEICSLTQSDYETAREWMLDGLA